MTNLKDTLANITRAIVDKPEEGKKILSEAGIVVRVTNVLSLTMEDTPGGTLGVLRLLAERGIGVEYMYAFAGKNDGEAIETMEEDTEVALELNLELLFLFA